MRTIAFILILFLLPTVSVAYGQDAGADKYVTKGEYDKLKRELEELKELVETLTEQQEATEEAFEGIDEELQSARNIGQAATQGSHKFLMSGFASAGFTDKVNSDSSFSASVSPVFLWKISDRLLFETELELSDAEFELGYAHISYLFNDYLTIGAGKFLTPFSTFGERIHPTWINKLPDMPMAFGHGTGIVPAASTGVQLRGGFLAGSTKWNYAAYVDNGGELNLGDSNLLGAGVVEFHNSSDNNNNKGIGGRIGFLPIPELELGYSFYNSRVGTSGDDNFGDVEVELFGVDLAYKRDFVPINGTLDFRAEWVWQDVGKVSYDPAGTVGFGPLTFSNKRDGGYVQLAYRPSLVDSAVMKNFEFVTRYDALNRPSGAPNAVDEERWTLGVNYWVGPSKVIKLAYQFDDKSDPLNVATDQDALMFQFAVGF